MKITKTFLLGICSCISLSMSAEGYQFPGGTGTSEDPYQIVTAEDLDHVRDYLGNSEVNFKLMNDIDLTEYLDGGSWQPIGGDVNNAFVGVFDGNNCTISNLLILGGSNGLGFFGRVQTPGEVRNLIIENAEVSGGDWCGILCSTNGNWERAGGTLKNCRVVNSYLEGNSCLGAIAGVNEGTVDGCAGINNTIEGAAGTIGGLLGECSANSSNSRVIDCFSSATVMGGGDNVSGLIGLFRIEQNPNYEAALQNCASYGDVSGNGAVAGIVAYQQGVTSTIIDNCYSACNVTGYQAGGIGGSPIDGKVTNCYASGTITANDGAEPWSGGIAGTAYQLLQDCYYSGVISGAGKIGGVCGRNWPSLVVSKCYYNSEGASMNMGEGHDEATFDAIGLLPEEMKSFDYIKFSNPDKWQIKQGVSFPYFKNQTDPITIEKCNLTGASGTYSGDVAEMFFSGSMSGGLYDVEVTFDNGVWTATWPDMSVYENEIVSVFALEEGKMPSQVATLKVDGSSSVEELEITQLANVFSGKGFVMLKNMSGTENLCYEMVNMSGLVVMSGIAEQDMTNISTERFPNGVYLLNVKSSERVECHKVIIK